MTGKVRTCGGGWLVGWEVLLVNWIIRFEE